MRIGFTHGIGLLAVSLPAAVARELEKVAVYTSPSEGESGMAGFLQGKVNDLEVSVPRGKVYNGPIWQPGINATEGEAHSGVRLQLNEVAA